MPIYMLANVASAGLLWTNSEYIVFILFYLMYFNWNFTDVLKLLWIDKWRRGGDSNSRSP